MLGPDTQSRAVLLETSSLVLVGFTRFLNIAVTETKVVPKCQQPPVNTTELSQNNEDINIPVLWEI